MLAIRRIVIPDHLTARIDKFLWKRDVNPVQYFRDDPSKWRGTKKQYTDAYKRYIFFRREIYRGGWDDRIADVDIDNDGASEPAYLASSQMGPNPALLLILKSDYSDIDYAKTKLVMMHPSRKEADLKDVKDIPPEVWKKQPELKFLGVTKLAAGDSFNSLNYDVFSYKNKTYFDMWGLTADSEHYGDSGNDRADRRLRVFFSNKGKTTEICSYKFILM